MAAPAVFHVHLEKQERRVRSAKLESIAHQKLNKAKKRIRRSVYLVQLVDTKIKKDKQHAFPVFLENSRMKQNRLNVSSALLILKVRFRIQLNAIHAMLVKVLMKEVQSVERAMRECLVINKVKSVRIVMWDSTVRRTMKSQLLVSHVLQDMHSALKAKRLAYRAFLESTRTRRSRPHACNVQRIQKVLNQIRRNVIPAMLVKAHYKAVQNATSVMQGSSVAR